MCGIVGYTGAQAAAPILLEGLKKLEQKKTGAVDRSCFIFFHFLFHNLIF